MTTLHERALVMAREIAAATMPNSPWSRAILAGRRDDHETVQIAIAAILATTELAASLVDERGIFSIAREIRDGAHLKKAPTHD